MFGRLTNYEGGLFDDLRRMQQEIDEMFSPRGWNAGIRSVARGTFPPINVGATPEGVDVFLFVSGVDPQTLDISIQQNLLTVVGERTLDFPANAQYYRQERFSGQFKRVISLPEDVDPDKVDAHYRDGILRIAVQRREASRPRQIEVK
jgi:HSP20 family protein